MDAEAQRSLRTGDLLALGVTRGELAGPRWRSPFRGVHAPVAGADSVLQRLYDAAALVPPGGVLAGWAAAYLLGATDLDGRGWSRTASYDVPVVVPRRCHLVARPGVRYVRCALPVDEVTEVDTIPVTRRLRTAIDLARWSGLEAGVVALDVMARQAALDPASVSRRLDRLVRLRGLPLARRAAAFADGGSRSVGESRLRLLWVLGAGLPAPPCNALVVDQNGTVLATPDLLDPDSGLCAEYDGGTHRELAAHTQDNAREEALEELGLVVVRATSLDLGRYRARTVERLLAGHRRARAAGAATWGWTPGRAPVYR